MSEAVPPALVGQMVTVGTTRMPLGMCSSCSRALIYGALTYAGAVRGDLDAAAAVGGRAARGTRRAYFGPAAPGHPAQHRSSVCARRLRVEHARRHPARRGRVQRGHRRVPPLPHGHAHPRRRPDRVRVPRDDE